MNPSMFKLYILLQFLKLSPHPFFYRVEFTCKGGQSYICYPDPVFLNFQDFFLPLPIPQSLKDHDVSWKRTLFERLWDEFQNEVLAE